jgi:RNA polymerase sigma-70 factor (ECF subfamily)
MEGGRGLSPWKDDDNSLMERVRHGDERAFEVLYDRYADLVFSLVTRMLGRETAEEVTQEVFVTLWQKAGQFEPARGSFSSWLLQVAHYRAIDELRRRRRRHSQLAPATEDLHRMIERLPDDDSSADRRVGNEVHHAIVTQALAELPSEQRAVITLAYFEGLTQAEIATKLNIPLGTVKKRVRLGLQKLKNAFVREGILKL